MRASPDLSDLSDQDVVALARLGREDAYGELLRRFQRPVHKMIYHMVHDHALAEDLTQETFVRLLDELDKYRPELKLSSWIFKIANNATIDQLRRRELDTLSLEGAPQATSPEQVEATALQIRHSGESPLEEVEARELGGQIERAIAQLRPEYQSCIILRHVEGRPYEEIADILDLPLGTVKTYIHRARNELKDILGEIHG